jgi:hypothetical protein
VRKVDESSVNEKEKYYDKHVNVIYLAANEFNNEHDKDEDD